MAHNIKLGDRVIHNVTKFKGIAVAFTQWLHGCDRICVQPEDLNKEGKPYENQTFDALELTVVKTGVVDSIHYPKVDKIVKATTLKKTTGGPRDDKAAQKRR